MADTDHDSKTEEATPERRRKAREEGQFPRAKDAGAVVGTAAVLLCLAAMAPLLASTIRELTVQCLSEPFNFARGDPRALGERAFSTFAVLAFPTALVAGIAAVATGFLEAGFHPRLDLAAPKWNRIDPVSKLKQLFSPRQTAVNIALSVGRVAVVAVVSWLVLSGAFPTLSRLARAGLPDAVAEVTGVAFRLAIWASVALAMLAVLDYVQSRFRHEQNIRMSRRELKDELQQQEGDQRIRARQRARAREQLKRGIAKQVMASDCVLTNPTHVSVAMRYRMAEGAPVVAAKGYDEIALYIRKLAREHDVPIVESPALARALASQVKVGRAIPVDLYAAVAEVLAVVYRMKNRGIRA